MEDVKERVLQAAKRLFAKQGYQKTTIRQIVEESGVQIGSIYYFYKNKEEIFQSLFLQIFESTDRLILERYGEELTPSIHYAALCTLELMAVETDPMICEFFYESYRTANLLNTLAEYFAAFASRIFCERLSLSKEEYYLRTVAASGLMYSMVTIHYSKHTISFLSYRNFFLRSMLHLFDRTDEEIEQTTKWITAKEEELRTLAQQIRCDSIFK